MLDNSPSRQFTMSVKIANAEVVAASVLRAAYFAVFSLLGPAGYHYVCGSALAPVRRLIAGPLRKGIAKFVDTAPQENTRQGHFVDHSARPLLDGQGRGADRDPPS